MTNPYRTFFRQAFVPPPDGFSKVLEIKLAARAQASSKGPICIWPQPPKDISQIIECKFNVSKQVLSSLNILSKGPFLFSADPHFDPLERIATPGSGDDFTEQLLQAAPIVNPVDKQICGKLLKNTVLPAHETKGHLEVNLSVERAAFEFKGIWLQLMRCLSETKDSFLDFPCQADQKLLMELYINPAVHELYAILKEESAWRPILENNDINLPASLLHRSVRRLQDRTVVGLIRFLKEKTNDDIGKFLTVVNNCVLKYNTSLSHNVPQILRELADGVGIDDLEDRVMQQAMAGLNETELMIAQNNVFKAKEAKAIVSTYMSLGFDASAVTISVFSQHYGQESVDAIPSLVIVREARKSLDNSGVQYPISPFASMEPMWDTLLEDIANKRSNYRRSASQMDVVKDFANFYRVWAPALSKAKTEILTNA
jgi:hypothetical protein